nr:MAG TPA: hypothetical protein [Caudoviricetes sp.]
MSYALATESLHKPGVINQSLSGPVLLTAKTAHINPTSKEEKAGQRLDFSYSTTTARVSIRCARYSVQQ